MFYVTYEYNAHKWSYLSIILNIDVVWAKKLKENV